MNAFALIKEQNVIEKRTKTNQEKKCKILKYNEEIRKHNELNPKNPKYTLRLLHKQYRTHYTRNYEEKRGLYWKVEILKNIIEGEHRILEHVKNIRGVCVKPKKELKHKFSDWDVTERDIRHYLQQCLLYEFDHRSVLYHINGWNDVINDDFEVILSYFIDRQYLNYEKMPEKKMWTFYDLKAKKKVGILFLRYYNELKPQQKERMGKFIGKYVGLIINRALQKYADSTECELAISLFKKLFKDYYHNLKKKIEKAYNKRKASIKNSHSAENKPPLYYRSSNSPNGESSFIVEVSKNAQQNTSSIEQQEGIEHLVVPERQEGIEQNVDLTEQTELECQDSIKQENNVLNFTNIYNFGGKGSNSSIEPSQNLMSNSPKNQSKELVAPLEGMVSGIKQENAGSNRKDGLIFANCDGAGLETADLAKLIGTTYYKLPNDTRPSIEPIKVENPPLDYKDFYAHYLKFDSYESNHEQKAFCPFHTKTSGSYEDVPSLNVNYENGKFYCFSCSFSGGSPYSFLLNLYEDSPEELAKIQTRTDFDLFILSNKWKEHEWEDSYAPDAQLQIKRKCKHAQWVKKNIVHTEIYTYESFDKCFHGEFIKYEKTRYDFDDGTKSFKINDGRLGMGIFYREKELVEALERGQGILVVEGERKVDLLCSMGFASTCLDTGANSTWNGRHSSLIKEHCKGSKFILLPDNDNAGRMYIEKWQTALKDIGIEGRIVQLPVGKKEDVMDYFKQGHTKEEFNEFIL